MQSIETPDRAMVVIPHPDDAESGCGGTVARWISEGAQVFFVLCTDGRAGTSDQEMVADRLAEIREQEQRHAAAVLGVSEVLCLGHPDGALDRTESLLGDLVHAIRHYRPDVVLSTAPHRVSSHQHQDHRAAGRVSEDACFPFARDPLHFPQHLREEGLQPYKVGTLLFWGADAPDVCVDITDTVDLKVLSLQKHASQMRAFGLGARIRGRAQEVGELAGCLYAETFSRITFRR